jgi:hypothetical protein
MEKLESISWRGYVSRMNKLGFEGPFFGGKHPKMKKGNLTIIIPNPHESEIGVGFLKRLFKTGGYKYRRMVGRLIPSLLLFFLSN